MHAASVDSEPEQEVIVTHAQHKRPSLMIIRGIEHPPLTPRTTNKKVATENSTVGSTTSISRRP